MSTGFNTKTELLLQSLFGIFLLASTWVDQKYGNTNFFLYAWFFLMFILFIFHNKFKGIDDELTKSILGKVNNICMMIVMGILFIVGGIMVSPNPTFNSVFVDKYQTGLTLLVFFVLTTILRLGLFIYYDRKGIIK